MLGPVFERELTSTARSARAYALRAVYGLALLGVLAAAWRAGSAGLTGPGGPTPAALSGLARGLFQNLLLAQGILVVFLTPALVAGAIAGEVQRKTLHDLLTSDLSSAEIVLGKLAARLLHVGVLVAAGLPILLLAGLLGGFEAWLVLAAAAATLSTAFFLGGLSILASTQVGSVRGAMNLVFTLALSWLIVPGAAGVLLPRASWFGPSAWAWVEPLNSCVAPSTPFVLWLDLMRGAVREPGALLARVLSMIGWQCLYGALLAALAVAALRPAYRSRQGRRSRRSARAEVAPTRRAGRAPRRTPCGEDAMLWKELFAPKPPLMYRPVGLSVALVLAWLLIRGTLDYAAPAFRELLAAGYGAAGSGSARALFHVYLRIVGTGIFLVHLLGVASDAAAGLASEREKDTWVSLIATPLTGTEIVRAKVIGAVWGIRHTALALLGLVAAGILAGSLHPISLPAAAVELAATTWFAAALGTWFSLRASDTMRAAARTMACLVLANGGSLLLTLPFLSLRPAALAGCSPVMLAASLASYAEVLGRPAPSVLGVISDGTLSALWGRGAAEMLGAIAASALGYSAAAWALTRSACGSFDAQLDRPRVDAGGGPPRAVGRSPRSGRARRGDQRRAGARVVS